MFCLAKIGKLISWELLPEEKPLTYSVRLNSKTKLLDARFALSSTIAQLKGLNKRFNFTVYGENGNVVYEYKN